LHNVTSSVIQQNFFRSVLPNCPCKPNWINYIECSESRLTAFWLYTWKFPVKALSHLLRKMLPRGQTCYHTLFILSLIINQI
jgi:hypothetical protein